MISLRRGDRVAVLPAKGAQVEDVLEIATVNYVSRAFIQLTDGRLYAKHDGRCMGSGQGGYIVPASIAHEEILQHRQQPHQSIDGQSVHCNNGYHRQDHPVA